MAPYPPLERGGGAEKVYKEIADNSPHKFDFYVTKLFKEKRNQKVKIHTKRILKNFPNFAHTLEIIASPFLWKEIKKNSQKYNLIIYDKIMGWCKPKDIEAIAYDHGNYAYAGLYLKEKGRILDKIAYLFYRYVIRFFERRSYLNAKKVVAVSKRVKEELINFYKIPEEKIITLPNGVDGRKFYPLKNKKKLRKKLGLSAEDFIILFPARASYGKGFDILIKIAKRFKKVLFIVTDKKRKVKLSNIKFVGKQLPKNMLYFYNAADIVLFPSRYEGNSLALLEAASCAKPILTSNVGLIKNDFKDERVRQFICKTEEEFIRKIEKLKENRERLSKAGNTWRKFVKKFNLKMQIQGMEAIIKKESILKLNLKWRKKKLKGFVNCKATKEGFPNFYIDPNKFPWPFKENTFDFIYVDNAPEHFSNFLKNMEEIWKISKPQAKVSIKIPLSPNLKSFANPTLCKVFAHANLNYFDPNFGLNSCPNIRFKILKRKIKFNKFFKIFEIINTSEKLQKAYCVLFSRIFPPASLEATLEVVK